MRALMRYRMNRLKRGAAGKLALLSSRFHGLFPAAEPFERLEYRWETDGGRLMVFLPGIGDVAEDFERRGFIEDARRHEVATGAMAVDAHFGYYASRRLHALIDDDVIAPARSHGYRQVWMVGISLGGFGAASYAATRPDEIAGLVLLAPYLGDAALIREIRAAGGVKNWEPGAVDAEDFPRRLWAWLKDEYAVGASRMPLYLGYGKGDRFADAHRLLADLIPPECVCAIPGRHDWTTWTQVWRHFMQDRERLFG